MQTATTRIYKAGTADIPLIRSISFEVWPLTYRDIISAEQIDYMLDMMYSVSSLEGQMRDGHTFLIAMDETRPVGFISFAPKKEDPATIKIHKLYILQSAQGRGLGRILIDEVVSSARETKAVALELQVNRHNKATLFYRRLGFEIVGEEDFAIGNGYLMNDFVMRMSLHEPRAAPPTA